MPHRFLLLFSLLLGTLPAASTPADTLRLVLLSTTDLHGHVLSWDYFADVPAPGQGLEGLVPVLDSIRSRHAHTLLVDAGDWLQGNPLAEFYAREDTVALFAGLTAFDRLGYDAAVIGNHEFNFGLPLLRHRIAQTATPMLAGNAVLHGTEVPAFAPYVLRRVGGLTVGIVGVTTPGSAVWDRPRVEGRLDFADGVASTARWVAAAREAGADLVLVVAHTGLEEGQAQPGAENFGRALATRVPGIDALVLAHSHRTLALHLDGPHGKRVPIVQAGRWGSHLGEITLDIVQGEVVHSAVRLHAGRAHRDPALAALAEPGHTATRARMQAPIATTPDRWDLSNARLGPHPAVNLIHAAQRAATGAQLSAAAAFTTNLVFGPGPITLGHLTQLYPFENMLYVIEMTGEEVRAYLEHSAQYYLPATTATVNPRWPGFNFDVLDGVEYTLHLNRPIGERVSGLRFEGRDVRPEDRFTVAVNSYRANGGGGFPGTGPDARVLREIDRPVRDLILDLLRDRERIAHDDLPASAWRLAFE